MSNITKSHKRNCRGTRCSKINRTVVPAVKREIDRRKAAMIFRHVRKTVAVYGRHGQMDLSKAKRSMHDRVRHRNISIRDGFSRRISLRAGVPQTGPKFGTDWRTAKFYTGRLLSSVAAVAASWSIFPTAEHLVLVSTILFLSLGKRRERGRGSIIPLVKIDVEARRRRGRCMYTLVHSTVTGHFVAWSQIHYLGNNEKYTNKSLSWFNHLIWRFHYLDIYILNIKIKYMYIEEIMRDV